MTLYMPIWYDAILYHASAGAEHDAILYNTSAGAEHN